MKTRCFITIVGITLVIGACSSEFMLNKNGRAYFLGSNSQAKYEMLCSSGDLEKVLAATHLSREMKDAFYRYNCSVDHGLQIAEAIEVALVVRKRSDKIMRSNKIVHFF